MAATVLNSLDNMLSQASAQGMWVRGLDSAVVATTAASTTCGYVSACRFPNSLVIPTLGGTVTGAYVTLCRMVGARASCVFVAALEVLLGTLTVSGNVFADGSIMPTRLVNGVSQVLATMIPMLVVNTALTATTPAVTITYTDQDGNTGNSAVLTLPTNPVINTAFCIMPHMVAGDTGIIDITNISISAGSAGVLKVYGLVPINNIPIDQTPYNAPMLDPIPQAQIMPRLVAADIISFYRYGLSTSDQLIAALAAVGDN